MSGGIEESNQQLEVHPPTSPPFSSRTSPSSSPLFHRRQMAPSAKQSSGRLTPTALSPPHSPSNSATPSLVSSVDASSLPPPPSFPSVDEDDDISRLTDLDIAAIPIPSLPPYPTALLDPPSTLSPTLSPSPTPRGHPPSSAASSTPTASTLRTLLTPYLTAYTGSQHTLSSSYASLTHLHSKAVSDASSAVKSCTKKALSLSNWTDVQHHVRLVSERLAKCQADVERCVKEVGQAKDGVAFIKDHLQAYAAQMQAECVAWVAQEEEKVRAYEQSLEAERAAAEGRQSELLALRSANIAAFQQMDATRQAVQAEEEELGRVSAERHRVDAQCAQLQARRTWLEERIQHSQQATADRQRATVEGEERCQQLRKEVGEMTSVVAQQKQRLQAVQEEEAAVQAEERAMSESVRGEKAEVDRSMADVALVQLRLASERAECATSQRERRKKRRLYEALTQAVRALKDELDEWEALKREADLGVARINDQEQHATTRLLRAQQSLSHAQSERGLLERGVEWAERGERRTSTMLKLRRAQIPHLQAEEAQAEAKVRSKAKERERIEDDCRTVSERLDTVKGSVASMQAQVDEDVVIQADVEHELTRLQGKLQRQSAVLEEVEEERSQLRKRVCDLSNTMLRERQRMDGKRREVDEWKKRITRVDRERTEAKEALLKLQGVHRGVQVAIERVEERTRGKEASTEELAARLSHLSSLHRTCLHEHDLERHQLQAIVGEERVLQATLIRRQSDAAQAWEQLHTLQAKTVQARREARHHSAVRRDKEAAREEWQQQLTAALADCEEARRLEEQMAELQAALLTEQRKRRGMEEEAKQPINVHRWRTQRDEGHHTYTLINLRRQRQQQLTTITQQTDDTQARLNAQLHTYAQLQRQSAAIARAGGVADEEGKATMAARCKALGNALEAARRGKEGDGPGDGGAEEGEAGHHPAVPAAPPQGRAGQEEAAGERHHHRHSRGSRGGGRRRRRAQATQLRRGRGSTMSTATPSSTSARRPRRSRRNS